MPRTFFKSLAHSHKAHDLIPGGAHTYAKGDDQYPQDMLPYIERGLGSHVWDLDGNEYIEYGAGLRAITLGHAFQPVIDAAYRAMQLGTNFARPARIEVEAAERFLDKVPGADMIKFAKHGSDCTTAAIKLARAYTGRETVAYCADHPFYSTDDWFIGKTPMNAGIPQSISDLTTSFRYNDLKSVEDLFLRHPNQIACLITEAETQEPPKPGFLQGMIDLCHKHGALFILDETITGFRWDIGGAQHVHGIVPDLSTFGKAMANGFSVSALCGKREFMDLGGIQHKQDRVFLLSTTHGAETHGLAAMMATLEEYAKRDVCGMMRAQGAKLRDGANAIACELGIQDYFWVYGKPECLVYATCDRNKQRSQPFRTLFLQETIRRGMIAPNLIVHAAHSDADIAQSLEIIRDALIVYRAALNDGVDKFLHGRSVKPVFRKAC